MAVDPTNQAVVYAAGELGLYKSLDAGSTWQLVFPAERPIIRVAVSPAAPEQLLIAVSVEGWYSSRDYRTLDGGRSWELVGPASSGDCPNVVTEWQWHPVDPTRVLGLRTCFAGRNSYGRLVETRDRGQLGAYDAIGPVAAFPLRLVGGEGTMPGRFYLVVGAAAYNRSNLVRTPYRLFRSDDDAQAWSQLVRFRTPTPGPAAAPPGERFASAATIAAVAYEPLEPDRVYIGRGGAASDVQYSLDGGETWAQLGSRDLPEIRDMALSIDGPTLYLATSEGVWRFHLADRSNDRN